MSAEFEVIQAGVPKWERSFPAYIQAGSPWQHALECYSWNSQPLRCIIDDIENKWTANPANGVVDYRGHQGKVAKDGYTLPGALEGALVGRIEPNGAPFVVEPGTPVDLSPGEALFLCINDDLNKRYGAGLSDNNGLLVVTIVVINWEGP